MGKMIRNRPAFRPAGTAAALLLFSTPRVRETSRKSTVAITLELDKERFRVAQSATASTAAAATVKTRDALLIKMLRSRIFRRTPMHRSHVPKWASSWSRCTGLHLPVANRRKSGTAGQIPRFWTGHSFRVTDDRACMSSCSATRYVLNRGMSLPFL
jgi:hypothetical protein